MQPTRQHLQAAQCRLDQAATTRDPALSSALALQSIASSLLAIGQQLSELNAKRPIIPIIHPDPFAPDDDSCGED